ncbi:hypothetical protein [Streptomyces sp. NPDC048442]|uniref:hypothetical protein n=1 Tax=Streptomyces sp. NPDC048442 TaxID=3154823 RepID=UPI003447B426
MLLLLLVVFWSQIWMYVAIAPASASASASAVTGGTLWWLSRTNRLLRQRDHTWRQADAVQAGHRI